MADIEGLKNLINNKQKLIEEKLKDEKTLEAQKKSLLFCRDLLDYCYFILETPITENIPNYIINVLYNNIATLNSSVLYNINVYPSILSNIMTTICSIPPITRDITTNQQLNQILKRFNEDANNLIEDIKNKKEDSEKEIKRIKNDFNNEKNNIKIDVASFKKQLQILKESYDSQQKLNQDLIGNLQKKFDEFKSLKEREFNDLQTSFIDDNKKRTEKNIEYANKIKEILELKKADVEKLWGIIGKSAISGQAQNYASTAFQFANIASGASLLLLVVACVISLRFVYQLLDGTDITFLKFLIRISISLISFMPSLYCMNIAKRQRDREFQLRDFEIKTAALEPFIEHMKFSNKENSPKDAMKLSLTQSFFDVNFSKENKHHKEILIPKDVKELVSEVIKSIKENDINKTNSKN